QDELNAIRESFKLVSSPDNRKMPSSSPSYYYPYVSFLILTGCRPEEAIALEWGDVNWIDLTISINKAFSYGQLKCTKNKKSRTITINPQLSSLLENDCPSKDQHRLIFPSADPGSEYIVQKNFNSRHFKPRIEKLHHNKIITKILPCYNIRNSWITLMLKKGIDIATVSKLSGTSERMIIDNYWGADDSTIIPEI
ncbi:MAG: tyrosine-type recombinase/integrase, partial [Bacteroidota bacterium]